MPWKFLLFLLVLAVVILFAGINVNNSADINLGFHQFEDVPVFVGLGSAFMLGALSILPFALGKAFIKRRKLSTKYKEQKKADQQKADQKKAEEGGRDGKLGRKARKALPDSSPPASGDEGSAGGALAATWGPSGGNSSSEGGGGKPKRKLFGKKPRS